MNIEQQYLADISRTAAHLGWGVYTMPHAVRLTSGALTIGLSHSVDSGFARARGLKPRWEASGTVRVSILLAAMARDPRMALRRLLAGSVHRMPDPSYAVDIRAMLDALRIDTRGERARMACDIVRQHFDPVASARDVAIVHTAIANESEADPVDVAREIVRALVAIHPTNDRCAALAALEAEG
jgi:hypothetical protein